MPRKRARPVVGLGDPVKWTELWGTPTQAQGQDFLEVLHQPDSLSDLRAKRAKLFEYDSDSENEDLAKQLVARHFEEECVHKSQRKADLRRLRDLYTAEEVAELRAELRQRAAQDGAPELELLAEQDVEGDDLTQYEREMGSRIEPFHTREERAAGHFDAAGFWVRDRADDATDAWLRSLEEPRAPPTTGAGPTGGGARPAPPPARPPAPGPPPTAAEDFARLLTMVRGGETVAAALRRLRAAAGPRGGGGPAVDQGAFDQLVETADRLVDAGAYQLWDTPHAALQELAEAAKRTEQEAQRARKAEVLWEYVWSRAEGAELFGPFTAGTMHGWQRAEFFSAERVAYTRPVPQDMFALEDPAWQEAHTVDYFA